MINIIWASFIILGIIYALITGNITLVNDEIVTSAKTSLDIFLGLLPTIVLWVGIMKIVSNSGLLNKISNMLYPLLSKLFPEIPKNHEALGYISSNITANILGLGNAATPFGLKAMASLQELNKEKDTASRSMITFILLNTSGLTLLPTTVISLRSMYNSTNPTLIIMPTIIITSIATISAIILDKIFKGEKNE
jgi:spore maturation protein A